MPGDAPHPLVRRLRRALLQTTRPIGPWRAGGDDGATIALPQRWARADQPVWFVHALDVDRDWRGRDLWLHLDVAEGLLHLDGAPYHGLDRQHHDVVLPGSLTGTATLALSIEASRAAPFGGAWFRAARAGVFDESSHRLLHALAAVCALATHLGPGRDRTRVEQVIERLDTVLDGGRRAPGPDVVSEALALLDDLVSHGGRPRGRVHLVGHSHIDVVWLWTLAETRRKCARTFSTALRLMERYPRFAFAQTQAQLYEFARDHSPAVYAQVRERVREGRWEPVGCTWVEPDCNIPNGESLVRQIACGRRFFAREFGAAGDTLWLPDTFGYAWSLPQILRLSGIRHFFTTKLRWNDTTVFPRHSFWWEGLDGSRVLAHIPPVGLEGLVTPRHLAKSWRQYAERARTPHVLMTYGYGDGGGGVTAEQLDAMPVFARAPGLPAAAPSSVSAFFRALARDGARLPVWRDELYLELHRGTYTTHAWLKRANRRAEAALYVTDLLCALADAVDGPGEREAVARALDGLWKRLLLNQFHDIVPGTAIEAAYDDTRRDVAALERGCAELQQRALARALPARSAEEAATFTVFNPLPWDRVEYLELARAGDRDQPVAPDGAPLPSQRVRGGGPPRVVCEVAVPAMGCAHVSLERRGAARAGRGPTSRELVLDTPRLRVEFDDRGAISRMVDTRSGRDCVAPGERLNVFQAFRDEPRHWEAWDIDPDYGRKPLDLFTHAAVRILEHGPVRWRARVTLASRGRTRLEQDVVIHRGSPRLDFRTRVRWHERRALLKVAFPLAVAASHATYEIPFGAIARPTRARTARDRARWEVAGQQWADLSARGHGVSLLNDSKYGYDCQGSTLRLTLIRSPRYPHHAEPMSKTSRRVTDQGPHEFTYALLSHAATWREAATVRRARELNVPVLVLPGRRTLVGPPLLRVDPPGVQVSSIALAERAGDLLIRLYESHGVACRARLQLGLACDEVREVDLDERPGREFSVRGSCIDVPFRAFQIRTLRITPRRAPSAADEESHGQ